MRFTRKIQPGGGGYCGHTAVAVFCRIPVEWVIEWVGKPGGTKTKDLTKILRHFGFTCPDRCVPIRARKPLPDYGIVQVHRPGSRNWHWVALVKNRIYDGNPAPWPTDYKLTSVLPIS